MQITPLFLASNVTSTLFTHSFPDAEWPDSPDPVRLSDLLTLEGDTPEAVEERLVDLTCAIVFNAAQATRFALVETTPAECEADIASLKLRGWSIIHRTPAENGTQILVIRAPRKK